MKNSLLYELQFPSRSYPYCSLSRIPPAGWRDYRSHPLRQAIADGYQKNVVVLTRNKGYQKKPISQPLRLLLKKKYRDYPNLIAAMLNRYQIYNKTLIYIDQLEQKDK